MGSATSKLSYGQVAVFTKQCYHDFVSSGGQIVSFNQKLSQPKKISPSTPPAEVPAIYTVTNAIEITVPEIKFLILGPRTRVRLYEQSGKNAIIENPFNNSVKVADCPEILKNITPMNIKLWISVYDDTNKPMEAFNMTGTCTKVCNDVSGVFGYLYSKLTLQNIFVLIIMILLLQIIYSKRKQLLC